MALEIRDDEAATRAMTRGELERDVAVYERLRATAPAEPSRELRVTSMIETNARAAAARLAAESQAEAAAERERQADAASVQATELEGRLEEYQKWEEATAGDRARAARATAELARRGQEVWADAERQAQSEHGSERGTEPPDEATEPVSLLDQFRQDMANVAALEAKLDREAEARERQPEAGAEPEELAPPDPERQASMDRTDATLATMAQARAETAQREASREAYTLQVRQAEAEATGPSAWVPGPHTPTWGGPGDSTTEPTPTAEVAESEAGL